SHCCGAHRALHSFPTRRSSDLVLGRAKMAGETDGFVKIVADKKYDEVLGVHMIGPRSTELVAEATVALRLEATVEELIRTIHARSEEHTSELQSLAYLVCRLLL